jgi:hypothetical protein
LFTVHRGFVVLTRTMGGVRYTGRARLGDYVGMYEAAAIVGCVPMTVYNLGLKGVIERRKDGAHPFYRVRDLLEQRARLHRARRGNQ